MSTPRFSLVTRFSLRQGDLVFLPFMDEKQALFDQGAIEGLVSGLDLSPPEEPGGESILFKGAVNNKQCMLLAARLDKKYGRPMEVLKEKVSKALGLLEEQGLERLSIPLSPGAEDMEPVVRSILEGVQLGGYRFDKYLSEKKRVPKAVCSLKDGASRGMKAWLKEYEQLFSWVNTARDLLNEPPSVMTPVALSESFRRFGKEAGLKVTIWNEKRLKRERMNAILAVGAGGSTPPRLVMGEYRAGASRAHLIFVGKGVTFDTGGYCLKPADAQTGMKFDMAGAAACFAAACAITQARIPINLTVITPLCENAISSSAYKTTDVIVTRSGKSVQVNNTDAEGRLILADALALAVERRPSWIIDVATLTGACVVALGEDIAGLMGQNRMLLDAVKAAGDEMGELFWELPLHMPYTEQLKTEIADIKNIGKRWAGAITGGLFLKEFVSDEIPWVHADIAGPAVKEEPLGHLGKGAKGFGVKTLFAVAKRLAEGGHG